MIQVDISSIEESRGRLAMHLLSRVNVCLMNVVIGICYRFLELVKDPMFD